MCVSHFLLYIDGRIAVLQSCEIRCVHVLEPAYISVKVKYVTSGRRLTLSHSFPLPWSPQYPSPSPEVGRDPQPIYAGYEIEAKKEPGTILYCFKSLRFCTCLLMKQDLRELEGHLRTSPCYQESPCGLIC